MKQEEELFSLIYEQVDGELDFRAYLTIQAP